MTTSLRRLSTTTVLSTTAVLGALALAVAAPASAAAPAPLDPQVATVLTATNDARAAAGCAPLVLAGPLTLAAARHSAEMAATATTTHRGADGSSPRTRLAAQGVTPRRTAENVASGYGANDVVDAWLGSAPHRASILDCRLALVGIAEAPGAAGPYWTQVFASA